MKPRVISVLIAASLAGTGLVAAASPASAAAPPKVKVALSGDQFVVSQSQMRPGIVEFSIGKTFVSPDPEQGEPEGIAIVRTDQLDYVLQQFGAIFADPTQPGAGAAAAQAMRNVRLASTWYGGGYEGTTYQVDLPAGTYYALGVGSTAMGMTKPAMFTVSGDRRTGELHPTSGTIRAVSTPDGGNQWVAKGMGSIGDGWMKFANSAKEIHFLNMDGVKPGTTNADIKKALATNDPGNLFTKTKYSVEVISPGVSVAVKGPFKAGKYFITCFVPSETDGMPHALMGMWKLVTVG